MATPLLHCQLRPWLALVLLLASSLTALAGRPAAPLANLSGTYYVGSSTSPNPAATYSTLTAAVAAYNSATLQGPVTFVLLDALYSAAETFPITVNSNPTASATNTLTIKPNAGANPVISYATMGGVIVLNGADYVIIDGSNTLGGTTRDLSIVNTIGPLSPLVNAVLWLAPAATNNGATNNVVKNTIITGVAGTSPTYFGVYVGGGPGTNPSGVGGTTLASCSNNTFSNNLIDRTYYGVFLYGMGPAGLDQGNAFIGNQLGQSGAGNGFLLSGLVAQFQQGLVVQGNEIQNIVGTPNVSHQGLSLGTVKGATITRNAIHDIQSTSTTSGNVAYGIWLISPTLNTSANASANVVSNNLVYSISAPLATTFSLPNVLGIANNGGYGDRIIFNTVLLNASQTTGTGSSAAISNGDAQNTTATTALEVRNNLIAITASVVTAAKYYGFYTTATSLGTTTLNYNDYYLASPGPATFAVGYLGGAAATLAAWQTATNQETNSQSINPQFGQAATAPFNLTPTAGTLDNAGTPLSGLTVDYNGVPRGTPPDIGAIEFTASSLDLRPADFTAPAATQVCFGTTEPLTVRIQNNGATALNFAANAATMTVVVTPPSGPAQSFSTTLTSGTLAAAATQSVTLPGTLNMSASGTYGFAVTATAVGDSNPANDNLTATRSNTGLALPYAEPFAASTLPTGFSTTGFAPSTTANNGATGSYGLRASLSSFSASASATTPVLGPVATASSLLTFDARFLNVGGGLTTLQNDKLEVQVAVCGGAFTTIYAITGANQSGTGTASPFFYTYSVPLPGVAAGQKIQVRFVATYGGATSTAFYTDLDNLNVVSLQPIDLAPLALVAPTATQGCYGPAETVTVRVRNAGSAALNFATNPATVSASIAGPGAPGGLVPVVINTGTLAAGATRDVTFAAPANLQAYGTYTFTLGGTVVGDANPGNDVLAPAPTIGVSAPAAGTLWPATANLCRSGTATLTLSGAAGGGIQYQSSASATGPFTDVAGATAASYTTPTLTTTTYYRAQVRCGSTVATSGVTAVTVNNPAAAAVTTPVTSCVGDPATLTATVAGGGSVRFFYTPTGSTFLTTSTTTGTTTTATTTNLTIPGSYTYYAEAYTPGGGSEYVGPAAPASPAPAPQAAGALFFDAWGPVTILNVTVYLAAGQPAGTVTIDLRQSSTGPVVNGQSRAFAVPANPGLTPMPYVVQLNYAVPAAGGYTLYLASATQGGLVYDSGGPNTSGYAYTSPSGTVRISGSGVWSSYFYFYNWQVSADCIAPLPRTPIQVNVVSHASANFYYTSATLCAGTAATLVPVLASGATAGTFSFATPPPAGVTLDPTTGVVTVSAAPTTAGYYLINNTVPASGSCGPVLSQATFTVRAVPPTPALISTGTPATGITLISSVSTGNQFYRNGVAIAGATGPTYFINSGAQNGSYTVAVTDTWGCSATSAPIAITVTASAAAAASPRLAIYPNPTHDGLLTLELTGYREPLAWQLVNTLGQRVAEGTASGSALPQKQTLNLSALPSGVYLLLARTASGTIETRRLVRE